jgi:Mn-dependent DtxR family transcriptional regulator
MRSNEFGRYRARILSLIRSSHGIVTTTEIASKFKLSWNTAERYLMELALESRVVRVKKAGVNLWVLKK